MPKQLESEGHFMGESFHQLALPQAQWPGKTFENCRFVNGCLSEIELVD